MTAERAEAEAPGPLDEHPAEHVAERLGAIVARHVQAAREAAAIPESDRRQARLEAVAAAMAGELKPIVAPLAGELAVVVPEDHPLRPFVESLASPSDVLADLFITFASFIAIVIGTIPALVSTFSQPFKNALWALWPHIPLAPADLANLVVQGYRTLESATAEAAETGLSADRFSDLVDINGLPPSPQDLFAMYRRGIIPIGTSPQDFPSVVAGLAQGHTKDEWIWLYTRLARIWPSPIDFVAAAVREQLPYDTAAQWAAAAGLDFTKDLADPPVDPEAAADTEAVPSTTFFDMLFDVAGRPPGPVEAAVMAWRGIIDWEGTGPGATTFQQSIAESDVKTKWTDALRALSTWVPTIAEVGAMYAEGVVDDATAETLWTHNRVEATQLPLLKTLYTLQATRTERETAKSNVVTLYEQGALSDAEATTELESLGFGPEVIGYLLRYAQYQRLQEQLTRLLEQVGRSYVTGKVDSPNAAAALMKFGIPQQQADGLLAEWQVAKSLSVPVVTPAQIASAVYYEVESPDEGMADLIALGFSPYNAWRTLSLRLHVPLPAKMTPSYPDAHVRPPGAQI